MVKREGGVVGFEDVFNRETGNEWFTTTKIVTCRVAAIPSSDLTTPFIEQSWQGIYV